MIKLNYQELLTTLDATPVEQSLLIVGKHGVGKSEIIKQYFNQKGFEIVTLFLGQMSDAGDILGLPKERVISESGVVTSVMDFLPPFWWQHEKPFLLFLDELNRARPEILQVIFDLVLNRQLGGRSLPKGSVVISACNYGDSYQITDLDPALVSRFNIYELDPTVQEWLEWGSKSGIDERILSFHSSILGYLDPPTEALPDSMDKTPDRRGWQRVSEIIAKIPDELTEVHLKIVAGIIGATATGMFNKHLKTTSSLTASALLLTNKFDLIAQKIVSLNIQQLSFLNSQILVYISAKQADIMADKEKLETVRANFFNYLQLLKKNKQHESIGELINLAIEKEATISILLCDSEIQNFFTKFISETKIA